MTDSSRRGGEAAQGFVFQVVHTLQVEAQAQALRELKRLLAAKRNWPGCLDTVGPDPIDGTTPNRLITRTRWRDVDCFVGWMVSRERSQLLKAMDGLGYSSSILVGNICSVALTGWLLVPAAQDLYGPWISGRSSGRGNQLALLSIAALLLLSWAISQQASG